MTEEGRRLAGPRYPALYQMNTRVRLHELGVALGRPATLEDVSDAELDHLAADGFDWVWLLGIWQTGEAGRQVSLHQPEWQAEYRELLPDFTGDDVCGSPFAIRDYVVNREFGGPRALERLRKRLADRRVKLMLDFVPNHTALDHPWVREHPEFYVHGSDADLEREPTNYIRVDTRAGPRVLAHGRDPYFPGWPDTLQVNYRHLGFREAMLGVLDRIAAECDGVRCDMAMLVLPDVIERTWGHRARAQAPAGLRLHGRSVLGSRVGPPAAGVRLHLRQGPVRPPARAGRGRRARPSPRRSRVSAAVRPFSREPRRAARGRRLSTGGSSSRRDARAPGAGASLHPRRAALGAAAAGFQSPPPSGVGARRPGAEVVLRPPP